MESSNSVMLTLWGSGQTRTDMAGKYRRPDKRDFRYHLILGLFILAAALGLAGMFYYGTHPGENRLLFGVFAIWTLFYAVTIYCWIDEDRYDRYEHFMIPVVSGVLFLLLVGLFIGGLIINIPKIASGEDMLVTVLSTAIAEASLGAAAFFIYKLYIKEYVDRIFKRK